MSEKLTNLEPQNSTTNHVLSISGYKDLLGLIPELKNEKENINEFHKKNILDMLKKGFNIKSKESYNGIKNLIEKLYNIKLCEFDEIINTEKTSRNKDYLFSITLDKSSNTAYLHPPIHGDYSTHFGKIVNGRFEEESWLNVITRNGAKYDYGHDNNKMNFNTSDTKSGENGGIQETIIKNKEETINSGEINQDNQPNIGNEKNILDKGNNNKVETEEKKHIEYSVKTGDTMWQIIKTHYALTSNTNIANIINKVVKYNIENNNELKLGIDVENDAIKGDRIYVGQKILIPNIIHFRKQIFENKS